MSPQHGCSWFREVGFDGGCQPERISLIAFGRPADSTERTLMHRFLAEQGRSATFLGTIQCKLPRFTLTRKAASTLPNRSTQDRDAIPPSNVTSRTGYCTTSPPFIVMNAFN